MRFSIRNIVAKNWILILLIFIACFLRFYRFEEFVTFLGDQGRDAMIIRDIVTLQHFPAIGAPSSIGQIYLGPFYYYLIAPFLPLFFFNPAGLAFGVAMLSIISIICGNFIIKNEEDSFTAIVFMTFVTVAFVLIELSRFSWNPNLLPYFSFFTLYFFTKLIQEKKLLYGIMFGAFLSFSIQLHHLAFLLFLPIGLTFLISVIKKMITSKDYKNYLVSLISFIFFSSPLILFDLKHEFLNTRNLLKLFTENKVLSPTSPLNRFLETNQSFFQHVFQVKFDLWEPVIFFIVILLITIQLFRTTPFKSHLFLKINCLNIIFYLIFFSLLNSSRFIHYYGTIYLSFFFILAYLFTVIKNRKIKYIAVVTFMLIFVISNAQKYYFFTEQPSNQIKYARTIADSFERKINRQPIQLVPMPSNESDGHIRYFLKLAGYTLINHDAPDLPEELYVVCFTQDCQVLGNGQWQIAAFSVKPPKIAAKWQSEGVTIYKLIH